MIRRLLLTTAVALSLTGMYGVYAALTQPLLNLPTLDVQPIELPHDSPPPRPVENVRVAHDYLPEQEWATNARYHLRSRQAFVYANDWETEGTSGRIRLKPFAMVWLVNDEKTGEENAITVVSESAVVRFAGSFELPSPEPGRLVFATLDGRSRVTGPDGLVLDGRNFFFSEAAERLWSDHEVRYEYAGNRGSAEKMQLDLIPQEGPPRNDRPHIFGVRNVRLSRNVIMELLFEQDGKELPLKIRCNGSLDYDILKQQAVFTDDVVAFRKTGPTEFDWIECERMSLQFASPQDGRPTRPLPTPGQPDQFQQLHPRLRFCWLRADAPPPVPPETSTALVRLFSTSYQLEARSSTLQYDGDRRQIQLTHPAGVQVLRARHPVLQCPEVTLTLGEESTLESALCRGAGWMVQRDPQTQAVMFAADWRQHLAHVHDAKSGLDQIELQDTASFRQPAEEMALGADTIRVWLKQPPPDKTTGNKPAEADPLGVSRDVGKVELQRMEATQDVVLVSPQLEARTGRLEAWVDPDAALPGGEDIALASGTKSSKDGAGSGDASDDAAVANQPITGKADVIRLRLRPRTEQSPDLADLWAEGGVMLRQVRDALKAPLTIEADRAHIENHGGMRQVAHLYGAPARLRDDQTQLEGHVMHLDRADNQFRVDGAGTLQLPMDRDLDGKPLAEPGILHLAWHERMSFDGLLATFRGQTSAQLTNHRMNCETMEVTFTERVRFDAPARGTEKIQPRSITCRDRVVLKSHTYEERKLMEIQQADVWELRIDRTSGEMHAQGPGNMQMWRRGKGPRTGLVPQQSAKANAAIQLDNSEWQYTKVKFDDRMTGNLNHRHAVFKQRVEIVHGPVQLPNQTLVHDQLPKGGGFMSCDELQVKQVKLPNDKRAYIQLAGDGNARIEGEGFTASADQVVFDEVREAYILRGNGRNNVRLWQQQAAGVDAPPITFQRGEYLPATNQLRIDAAANAHISQ